MINKLRPFLCLLAGAAMGSETPAEDSKGEGWFEHSAERAWLGDFDPTLIGRRLYSELTYEDLEDNRSTWKLETSLRWPIPIRDGLALGLQVMVPVTWVDTGASDLDGFSDIEVRTGLVGRISPTLRYGLVVNSAFDSASDSGLGGNSWRLRPIGALRWDAADRLQLGVNVEYTFTPRDAGEADVSALEIKLPVVVKLTNNWSGALTYKPRWNLLTDDNRHRLEIGVSHAWGSSRQFSWSGSVEVPLVSESLDWKLISGLAWHF